MCVHFAVANWKKSFTAGCDVDLYERSLIYSPVYEEFICFCALKVSIVISNFQTKNLIFSRITSNFSPLNEWMNRSTQCYCFFKTFFSVTKITNCYKAMTSLFLIADLLLHSLSAPQLNTLLTCTNMKILTSSGQNVNPVYCGSSGRLFVLEPQLQKKNPKRRLCIQWQLLLHKLVIKTWL